MRLKEPGVGELFVEEEDGEADGAVGAEDQGLFDVGGFGGAGDEGGEAVGGDGGFEEGDAVVSLVHVGDDIAAVDAASANGWICGQLEMTRFAAGNFSCRMVPMRANPETV